MVVKNLVSCIEERAQTESVWERTRCLEECLHSIGRGSQDTEENRATRVKLCSPPFASNYLGGQSKQDETGGACSAHGTAEKRVKKFLKESLQRRDYLEDGRIILK